MSKYVKLGVLIDVSHNFNDGFILENLISSLKHIKITGFHLSDAIAEVDIEKGTHLAIGKGNINFEEVISHFRFDDSVYGALEVRCSSGDIIDSKAKLQCIFDKLSSLNSAVRLEDERYIT